MFKRKKKELKINDNLIPEIVEYKVKYEIRFTSNEGEILEFTKEDNIKFLDIPPITSVERIISEIFRRHKHNSSIIVNNKMYIIDEMYTIKLLKYEKIEENGGV